MLRAVRDIGWVTGAMAASRILTFLSAVVVARLLSVDDFAAYLVLVVVATIVVPIADVGLSSVVTREASGEGSGRGRPQRSLVHAADSSRLWFWSALLLVSALWGLLRGSETLLLLPLVVLASIGQARTETVAGEMNGEGRFAAGATTRALPALLNAVGVAVLVVVGATLTTAILVFTISRLLGALPGVRPLRQPRSVPRIALRAGFPFAVANTLAAIYVGSDLMFLTLFDVPPLEVAVYGVAYRIIAALQILPVAVGTALFPRLVGASSESSQGLITVALGAALLTSCVVLIPVLTAPAWIFAMFGSAYGENVEFVYPLLLVLPPMAAAGVLVASLQGRGLEHKASAILASAVVLNILGHLILIPRVGAQGAMLATTLAEWCVVIGAAHTLTVSSNLRATSWLIPGCLGALSVAAFAGVESVALGVGLGGVLSLALVTDAYAMRTAGIQLLRPGGPRSPRPM